MVSIIVLSLNWMFAATVVGDPPAARVVPEKQAVEVLSNPPIFGGVTAFALSPDGSLLAYSHTVFEAKEFQQVVVIRNLKTGQTDHVLKAHAHAAAVLAFSANGKSIPEAVKGDILDSVWQSEEK